jgi:hypothetical protein
MTQFQRLLMFTHVPCVLYKLDLIKTKTFWDVYVNFVNLSKLVLIKKIILSVKKIYSRSEIFYDALLLNCDYNLHNFAWKKKNLWIYIFLCVYWALNKHQEVITCYVNIPKIKYFNWVKKNCVSFHKHLYKYMLYKLTA